MITGIQRCPGGASQPIAGSNPFLDNGNLTGKCDPAQVIPMMRKLIKIALVIVALVLAVILVRGCSDDSDAYKVRAVFDNGCLRGQGHRRASRRRQRRQRQVELTFRGPAKKAGTTDNTVPGKAIMVMKITDPGFQDFREDASCLIRPQSLIGEKFLDCPVTEAPASDGTEAPPSLTQIPEGEPGAGQYLLPIENNLTSVDLDLINNIYRLPYAQRFRIILNELGAGLATRGEDLREAVIRANPTLKEVNEVLEILASENKRLAKLSVDGAKNMTALAAKRKNLVNFLRNAGYTAAATAERGEDLRENIRLLPDHSPTS